MSFAENIRTNVKTMDDIRKTFQQVGETLNNLSATVSSDGMTADPETDTEDGYLTVVIDGTSYQVPIYTA